MSNLNRSRLLAYMVVLFLAGAATGALITWQLAERHFAALRPAPDITALLRDRLKAAVPLTAEQQLQVEPLLQQAGARMQQMRVDHIAQYSRARAEFYHQLEPLLTPAQRQSLATMENKYLEDIQRRYNLPPDKAGGKSP